MAHIEKRYYIRTGVIEVEQVEAPMIGNHNSRNERSSPTEEAVRKVNQRRAAKELRRLIDKNFIPGDIYMTLTTKATEKWDYSQAKRIIKKFIDKMRYRYRKRGHPLKYIYAIGVKKRGRYHFHIILNSIDNFDYLRELPKIWPYGKAQTELLYEEGRYMQLAEYMVRHKEENWKVLGEEVENAQAYVPSRNLKKPRVKWKVITEKDIRRAPKVPTGYRLEMDEIDNGISKQSGYMYRYFRLIKVERKRE